MSNTPESDVEHETPSVNNNEQDDDESSDIFVSELLESNGFEVNMDNN